MPEQPNEIEAAFQKQWQQKQQVFLAALNALCKEHGVVLEGQLRLLPAFLTAAPPQVAPPGVQ